MHLSKDIWNLKVDYDSCYIRGQIKPLTHESLSCIFTPICFECDYIYI